MATSRANDLEWNLWPIVEALGLDNVIEKLGTKEVIKQIGKDVLEAMEIDEIVESLPPARRRALLQCLSARSQGEENSEQ